MNNNKIIITGAAGFIASCLANSLLRQKQTIVLVDDFSKKEKENNLLQLKNCEQIDRTLFLENLDDFDCSTIIHLGARTDTTEMDYTIHEKLNLEYTKTLWHYASERQVNFIYASSAATYGDGTLGYNDDHNIVEQLKPLNPYGVSKNEFDKYALSCNTSPVKWHGLKFFNVYGPNEYHKNRMASVIFHAFKQIKECKEMKLFKSHHINYAHGEQSRDFIYVKDVISVIEWLMHHKAENGLYNLGTGTARTFNDLTKAVFKSMQLPEKISYIDTPIDIREKYQYFTEANMSKIKTAGYTKPFYNLEDGIKDYITSYLKEAKYF